MAVLIEAISVVTRLSTLGYKFPGGVCEYQANCPNATYCADEHLARIGFMHPDDVGAFVEWLERFSFILLGEEGFADLAVVDQLFGPTTRCDWLGYAKDPRGFSFAWLRGAAPGEVAAPPGWRVESSLSSNFNFVPNGRASNKMKYLRTEKGMDVFMDGVTGKEVYVGRTSHSARGRN